MTNRVLFKIPISVLVIIYKNPKEILLLKRAKDKNFWQSVTGSIELTDNSIIQTALREITEETGLDINSGSLINHNYRAWYDIYPELMYKYPTGVVKNLEHCFSFKISQDFKPLNIRLSHEHSEFAWVSKQDAIDMVLSDSNKLAIDKFVK